MKKENLIVDRSFKQNLLKASFLLTVSYKLLSKPKGLIKISRMFYILYQKNFMNAFPDY